MKSILRCRRSILALVGIACLTALGLAKGADVAMSIAAICGAVAGANAFEGKGKPCA
jgi:hypothetical protein